MTTLLSPERAATGGEAGSSAARRRSSSLVHEVPDPTGDDQKDQLGEANNNANWVNQKGEPSAVWAC